VYLHQGTRKAAMNNILTNATFSLSSSVEKYFACESGAVAVEYSLIAGAMFLAISPAFYLLRDSILVKFNDIATYLTAF
jgi:Flp pilus assembly pilin Flp